MGRFLCRYFENRIDQKGFDLLLELAKESRLTEAIKAQFSGATINSFESKPVLHSALRTLKDPILVEGRIF